MFEIDTQVIRCRLLSIFAILRFDYQFPVYPATLIRGEPTHSLLIHALSSDYIYPHRYAYGI